MSKGRKNMGTIRRRPDGRWEGRYTAPDGRQHSVYAWKQEECAKKLRAALRDVDAGDWLQPTAITVGAWLDTWLSDCLGHTSGRTVETYTWLVKRRFKPALGRVRLTDLNQVHVRRFVADLQKSGKSPATIRQARCVLKSALGAAVAAGLIKSNPVDGVQSPRLAPRRFAVVDRDLFPAFIAEARKTEYGDAMMLMLMTGIRAGELRGLQWADLDLESGLMAVRRQLHAPSCQSREFRAPKDGEARDIQLPPEALALLKAHRRRQLEQRVAAGAAWQEDEISADLVFRRPDGRNYDQSGLYRAAKDVGAALGLEGFHPHDLRHSYAVAALRSGIDVKTVQHNLGHKSATITLDIYAAYTSDAGKAAAARFSAYWQEALKNSN